jgi:hypothetical protein
MGQLYTVSRGTHALSTSNDSITINVPAGRGLKIHYGEVTGMASAAAAGAELGIFRVTSNGAGSPQVTLDLKGVEPSTQGVAGFSASYSADAQPTIESAPVWRFAFQPLGGKDRYLALPGGELRFWSATAHQVSVRGIFGTSNAAVQLLVELE